MNRELSLLEFQRRVLEEARDAQNKLLERVKFLSIVCSNIDEFFMVRVAALKQKLATGTQALSIDGKTVTRQIRPPHVRAARRDHELQRRSYDLLSEAVACWPEAACSIELVVIARTSLRSMIASAPRWINITRKRCFRC